MQRDLELEIGSLAGPGLNPDPTAHEGHQALADRQSEAGAAVLAGGGGIHLAERLKQPVHTVGRNPDSRIANGHTQKRLREAGGGREAASSSSSSSPAAVKGLSSPPSVPPTPPPPRRWALGLWECCSSEAAGRKRLLVCMMAAEASVGG